MTKISLLILVSLATATSLVKQASGQWNACFPSLLGICGYGVTGNTKKHLPLRS